VMGKKMGSVKGPMVSEAGDFSLELRGSFPLWVSRRHAGWFVSLGGKFSAFGCSQRFFRLLMIYWYSRIFSESLGYSMIPVQSSTCEFELWA